MENNPYQLYSSVERQQVDWLWYPYIPYGKVTLLQGDPGDGKSTCMIHLAASLSTGGRLPDGTSIPAAQNVIYQCAEDNVGDTVKPRMEQAGADCSRIAFISCSEKEPLRLTDKRIEETIRLLEAKLLIIDPVQAFFTQDGEMHSAVKARAVMGNLARIAEKYKCAVVLIGHLNKSAGGKNLYRGLGSIDIAAIARSVLMVTRDRQMPDIRYLSQIKSSLAPEGGSVAFIIDSDVGFQWIGRCSVRAMDDRMELMEPERKTKIWRVKNIIRLMLTADDVPSNAVIDTMKNLNVSERTVRRAAKEIGVTAYRKRYVWYWKLEPESSDGNE
ncbi:MAG: AAA family ATPase [Lachnospiraceae bacterium]|nr:AAA family ATPase [Lachnospiraceae bacterium]